MAVQKGKQGTKGQKQILEENRQTIQYYSIAALAFTAIYYAVMFFLYSEHLTFKYWFLSALAVLVHLAAISTMKYMAKPTYSDSGALIDGGIDLDLQGGFAENLKDVVILTSAVQFLSLFSNYFWLLWLLGPIRACYMLWTSVIAPWVFAPAPEQDEEVNEKKQRKLDRRQRRAMQ